MTTVTFNSPEFGIARRVFKALARMGMIKPMPIQSQCIPLLLEGKDLLVRSETGSGKTLAYGIPLVQLLLRKQSSSNNNNNNNGGCRGLVIVPSTELVTQVAHVLQQLIFYCTNEIRILGISNKQSIAAQTAQLQRCPEIIVATPTRLLQHLQQNHFTLDSLQFLVVDEADLVLSCGYEDDMKEIIMALPRLYQAVLMSATLTADVKTLESLILHNSQVITDQKNQTNTTNYNNTGQQQVEEEPLQLREYFIRCPAKDKHLLVYGLLKLSMLQGKLLFFVNTHDECYRLKLFLEQFSISSAVLNADLPYNSRQSIIEHFNRGLFDILIATDQSLEVDDDVKTTMDDKNDDDDDDDMKEEEVIMSDDNGDDDDDEDNDDVVRESTVGVSRGVDFQRVAAVINFSFPKSIKSYIHRVGRTARGDSSGIAVSLVSINESNMLRQVRLSQIADESTRNSIETLDDDDDRVRLNALVAPMNEIEPFRYRVEDQLRLVSRSSIREARLREVRQEMLHSEKLKGHFEDNPLEYSLLKHDKVLRPSKVPLHLRTIPKYLLPSNQKHIASLTPTTKKYRRKRYNHNLKFKKKRRMNDPLQTFRYNKRKKKKKQQRKR